MRIRKLLAGATLSAVLVFSMGIVSLAAGSPSTANQDTAEVVAAESKATGGAIADGSAASVDTSTLAADLVAAGVSQAQANQIVAYSSGVSVSANVAGAAVWVKPVTPSVAASATTDSISVINTMVAADATLDPNTAQIKVIDISVLDGANNSVASAANPVTLTVGMAGVKTGDAVRARHFGANGWEDYPAVAGNGTVTVAAPGLSPIAIVKLSSKNTRSGAGISPNTGETVILSIIIAASVIGFAAARKRYSK
ncbi:MAG: hypothetical protein K6G57_05130 [Lachnospiraceae bacterium]|nr:hypothetical protein [Lachnospiraceae bacterium]